MARTSISVAAENVRQSLAAHAPVQACCFQTVERQPGPGCNQTAQDIPTFLDNNGRLNFAKQGCSRCGRLQGFRQANQLGPVASLVRDTKSSVLFLLMPVAAHAEMSLSLAVSTYVPCQLAHGAGSAGRRLSGTTPLSEYGAVPSGKSKSDMAYARWAATTTVVTPSPWLCWHLAFGVQRRRLPSVIDGDRDMKTYFHTLVVHEVIFRRTIRMDSDLIPGVAYLKHKSLRRCTLSRGLVACATRRLDAARGKSQQLCSCNGSWFTASSRKNGQYIVDCIAVHV